MSSLIPPLLPDELLYSLPGRILKSYPSINATGVRMLFGGQFPTSKMFPCRLASIAKALTYKSAPAAEELARRHTFYPFLAPFISRASADILLQSHLSETPTWRVSRTECFRRSKAAATLRGCRQCMAEDIRLLGTAYWHRLHQIPALRICHKHQTPLVKSGVGMGEALTFPFIEESLLDIPCSEKFSSRLQKVLCAGFETLAQFDKPFPDRAQLHHTIYSALSSAALIDGKTYADEKVAEMLFAEYGESALGEVGFTTSTMIREHIRANFRKGAVDRSAHPVLTILFAALSGEPFRALIERAVGCAPAFSNYKMCDRQSRSILGAEADGANSVAPPSPPKQPSWLPQLRGLWSDRKQTWMSLAVTIGQSRAKMAYQAAKLRLPNMPGRKIDSQRAHALGKRRKRLDWSARWHRRVGEFAAFKKAYPDARGATLAKVNLNLYLWVRTNRPDLFSTLVPTKANLPSDSHFEEIDQTTAASIRKVGPTARAALLRSHHKITRARLLQAMNQKLPLNSRRRPIHSLTALSEFVETDHQHFERLFESMRESLKSGGSRGQIDLVVKNAHLHRYYVNFENYRTRIREAILDARLAANLRRHPRAAPIP